MSSDLLTSGRLLARNSFWSLAGNAAPLAAAAFAIPFLIRGLGTPRFGLLTLAWAFVGYLGLFDLGLGRSLTKVIAERLGADQRDGIPAIVATGLAVLTALGSAGAALGAAFSATLVDALATPDHLRAEGVRSFFWLSASLPIVLGTAGLRGVLAAYQRFDLINLVRVPLGVFVYLSPLLVLPFTDSLPAVVAVLVAGRALVLLIYIILCWRFLPHEGSAYRFDADAARELIAYGRWLTVSNIVGPLLGYLDRFLVGGVVGVAIVAYYTTPYEVVTKLWLVPGAILGVLFPAFATMFARSPERTSGLFRQGLAATYGLLAPVVLAVIAYAPDGLTLWLGDDYGARSTPVLRLLAAGVLINSLAQIASALVQGLGRPDATAKLHLAEFVLYLPLLWILVRTYGIVGAATAWVIRVSLDAVALFVLSSRLLPSPRNGLVHLVPVLLVTAALMGALTRPLPGLARIGALAAGVAIVVALAWRGLLDDSDRAAVKQALSRQD